MKSCGTAVGLMIKYVDFLNQWSSETIINLIEIENYWAAQIRDYFQNKPFMLSADISKTIGANLDDLFAQAKKRQRDNPGTHYLGIILQHLVAAKLSTIMPNNSFIIHGASVADTPTDRNGDFVINHTIIHCTTMPSNALLDKCKQNIACGCHPVIVTIFERLQTAINLAEDIGISGRVDVWDVQQFIASNVYEHSLFDETKRNTTLKDIINKYNDIILSVENDPSLRIEFDAM
ncbi:MAG: DUF4928 family protein [Proteobacteria bacterium]|nr:DUF4928 family protein [Pseudomonadota bacterium]